MAPAPRYQTYRRNVQVGANQHLAFAAGKGYYAAAGKTVSRPVPHKGPAAQAPDPLRALANRLLAAQSQPLTVAEQRRQQEVERQQQEINQTRAQLIQYLTGAIAPATQAYDSAIQQTDQLGKNAAALLGSANPTAQDSALLKAIGAPDSQQAQLAAANQARFGGQGGVLYTQGATVPGQSLAAGKAANAAYLASLPATASLQAGQGLAALGRSSDQAHQAYVDELAKIRATFPQVYQQLQAQEQAYQQKQQALLLNQQAANALTGYRNTQIAQGNRRLNQAQQRIQNQQQQFQTKQQAAQAKAAAASRAKSAAAAGKSAKARQTAFYSARAKVFKTAQSLYDGTKKSTGGGGVPIGAGSAPSVLAGPAAPYQKAYAKLWNTYAPSLIAAGVKRKAIQQMLRAALKNAGYATPAAKVVPNYNGPH